MYRNIGKKLMGLAKVWGVLSFAAGVLTAIGGLPVLNSYRGGTAYLLVLAAAALIALAGYLSSWLLYALGQLADDTRANRIHLEQLARDAGRLPEEEFPRL